ncbi:class I SAM-dependent methyltransferase [Candidatus Poribacteria bacterium]
MKYYYPEHISGYQRIKAEGKTAWNEIHGETGFENFSSRVFLEEALPQLRFSTTNPKVLECGCGTGPGACFLAERGFQVTGIDLIPTAIELAKQFAKERNLDIRYQVQDVCELSHEGEEYDMIVDSYCLQGIVTDRDREKVFSAIRARLKPEGYYLVSTAMFHKHEFSEDRVVDAETGIVYNRYGKDMFINTQTSIVYEVLEGSPDDYEDAIRITGTWYLPHRRHRKPPALRAELGAAGFRVLYQSGEEGGNAICIVGGSTANLSL